MKAYGGGLIKQKAWIVVLPLVVWLFGSGCYRYIPTRLDVTPPGESLRLTVTRAGAVELNDITELTTAAPILNGDLVRVDESVVLLLVPLEERRMGIHTEALAQTIRIPLGEVLTIERRELDPVRTGLLVSGTVAGAASVIFLILDASGWLTPIDGEGPIEEAMSKLFSFSVPIGPF